MRVDRRFPSTVIERMTAAERPNIPLELHVQLILMYVHLHYSENVLSGESRVIAAYLIECDTDAGTDEIALILQWNAQAVAAETLAMRRRYCEDIATRSLVGGIREKVALEWARQCGANVHAAANAHVH